MNFRNIYIISFSYLIKGRSLNMSVIRIPLQYILKCLLTSSALKTPVRSFPESYKKIMVSKYFLYSVGEVNKLSAILNREPWQEHSLKISSRFYA